MTNGFLLSHAEKYFKERCSTYKIAEIPKLTKWAQQMQSAKSKDVVSIYFNVMDEIKEHVEQISKHVNWNKMPENIEDKHLLWFYRECVVAISFITCAQIFTENTQLKIGSAPERQIIKSEGYAIIMGSVGLTSDIDVSIRAPNASDFIAVLEDLWLLIKWFDHTLWKVDLYGDFTMIGSHYMDTRFFTKDTLLDLLRLAIASYFRHEHSDKFHTKILIKLVKWYIIDQGILVPDIADLVKDAKSLVGKVKRANREVYYKLLADSEKLRDKITSLYDRRIISKKLNIALGECVAKLSEANLYKEENYVLVPTVIHIVNIEQGKNNKSGLCPPLLTTIAKCSLNSGMYILSMIEQLGYLQEKEHETRLVCSVSGSKYFGRFIRGLNLVLTNKNAPNILEKTNNFKHTMEMSDHLNDIKKMRGKEGNQDMTCYDDIDLYDIILEMFGR